MKPASYANKKFVNNQGIININAVEGGGGGLADNTITWKGI